MTRQEQLDYLEHKFKIVREHQYWVGNAKGNDAQMNAMYDWLTALTDMVGVMVKTVETDDGK